MVNKIKPEDSVTITTTYEELARVYAAIGPINGRPYVSEDIFQTIKKIIDPDRKIYDKFAGDIDLRNYVDSKYFWLKQLFPQETEQQKQIRELQEMIKKAEEQLEELKKGI